MTFMICIMANLYQTKARFCKRYLVNMSQGHLAPRNYNIWQMRRKGELYSKWSDSWAQNVCLTLMPTVLLIIIIISFITVFAGVLFVHQPGANHAPRASVTQVNHSVHTLSTLVIIIIILLIKLMWPLRTVVVIIVYRDYHPLFRKWARAPASTDRESGGNRAYCCHWISTPRHSP